jgi:putative DNA primase/helicase
MKHLLSHGFSIVPIRADKRPACKWKQYQSEPMTETEYDSVFRAAKGVALVCGAVSGNLECIDIDLKYDVSGTLYQRLCDAIPSELLRKLTIQKTPSGGKHFWYRTESATGAGNMKLANRPATESELQAYNKDATRKITDPNRLPSVLLETRGESGYALIAPSNGYVIEHGSFEYLATITNAERDQLIEICRGFDEIKNEPVIPPAPKKTEIASDSKRPGDAFNEAHDAFEILSRHGWVESHREGNKLIRITRPGRPMGTKSGVHNGHMVFIHSTSTPFPTEKWLSAFDIYTILDHNGDYPAAARQLYKDGYGDRVQAKTKPKPSTNTNTNTDAAPKPETPTNYFAPLGFNKDESGSLRFWFYAFEFKTIVSMTPSKMTKSNLNQLAPLEWWSTSFPKNSGFNTDAAVDFLQTICQKKGYFSNDRLRGRGAWLDHGRIIVHTGTNLIIDGKNRPLGVDDTEFVYEIGSNMDLSVSDPLSSSDASKLFKVIDGLDWVRPIDSKLLAGWLAIVPICGVLEWRPHIWITGGAGSGKSSINKKILHRMTGECSLKFEGGTTEAGLRESIGNDAIAALMDEAEGENEKEQLNMENILHLARSASSSDSIIAKGTGNGAKIYRTRSMFGFCSIVPQTKQAADKRRFSVLRLGKGIKRDKFEKLMSFYESFATPEYVKRFQARMVNLMPNILETIRTFKKAITDKLGRSDMGDQLGSMLGGWYHIENDAPVSLETASAIVSELDFEGEQGMETIPDEIRCLQHITSIEMRVETEQGYQTRIVGELIKTVMDNVIDGDPVTANIADKALRRIGIKVESEKGLLFISNTAKKLTANLRGTPWSTDRRSVLIRLEGAEHIRLKRFISGIATPAISIPLETVIDDEPEFATGFESNEDDDDCPF